MSTLKRRVERLHEKLLPDDDGLYTLEELIHMMKIEDPQYFAEFCKKPENYMFAQVAEQPAPPRVRRWARQREREGLAAQGSERHVGLDGRR